MINRECDVDRVHGAGYVDCSDWYPIAVRLHHAYVTSSKRYRSLSSYLTLPNELADMTQCYGFLNLVITASRSVEMAVKSARILISIVSSSDTHTSTGHVSGSATDFVG